MKHMAQVCETKSNQLMSMVLPFKPLIDKWSPSGTSSDQTWPQGLYQAVSSGQSFPHQCLVIWADNRCTKENDFFQWARR